MKSALSRLLALSAVTCGVAVGLLFAAPATQPEGKLSALERPIGKAGDLISDYDRHNRFDDWLTRLPQAERDRAIRELNAFTVVVKDSVRRSTVDGKASWRFAKPHERPDVDVNADDVPHGQLKIAADGPVVIDDDGNKLMHLVFKWSPAPGHAFDRIGNKIVGKETVNFIIAVALSPDPHPATHPSLDIPGNQGHGAPTSKDD